jgi:hypothetical protein
VGETKRTFGIRYKEHLADIRHGRDTPVARHFILPNHHLSDVVPRIIEFLTADPEVADNTSIRRDREHYWIHQLKTHNPMGINKFF